jgi:hypothetical protein
MNWSTNRLLSLIGLLIFFCCNACKKIPGVSPPLSANLVARWQWVRTVTPTRTITPQTAGYGQELRFGNDGVNGDCILFYRNDTLQTKHLELKSFYQEGTDAEGNYTLLLQYGGGPTSGAHFIKYRFKKNEQNVVDEMQTSALLLNYSEQADTVRHFYQWRGHITGPLN